MDRYFISLWIFRRSSHFLETLPILIRHSSVIIGGQRSDNKNWGGPRIRRKSIKYVQYIFSNFSPSRQIVQTVEKVFAFVNVLMIVLGKTLRKSNPIMHHTFTAHMLRDNSISFSCLADQRTGNHKLNSIQMLFIGTKPHHCWLPLIHSFSSSYPDKIS